MLLRELAVDEDIRQEIFDNSGLDAILEAMDMFPMEEECQITGCAFLSLVLRNRKIFRDLVERDVVVLVINALHNHPDNARVCEEAMNALLPLIRDKRVVEMLIKLEAMKVLVTNMSHFLLEQQTLLRIGDVVRACVEQSPKLHKQFEEARGVDHCLGCFQE